MIEDQRESEILEMKPMSTLTHVFDGPKYIVSYDTVKEAIKEAYKYPKFLFKRKGNTYVANHSEYILWLNNNLKEKINV